MMFRLPTECLNEILEYLEEDKTTLHSCLSVDRLLCEVSVKILWRDIWSYKYIRHFQHKSKIAILSTLVACLPDESKEIFRRNEISISIPTPNLPLFNYAAFCNILSIDIIYQTIDDVFYPTYNISVIPPMILYNNFLIANEIIKMFLSQISSLKRLSYSIHWSYEYLIDLSFTCLPKARNCLIDLSELDCSSKVNPEFFYQLSQTCYNLQSITIRFQSKPVSNELKKLISLQKNLKNLSILASDYWNDWTSIIPVLTKHSNTLTKLHICCNYDLPLLFVTLFSNLQEIEFSSSLHSYAIERFKELQHVTFPKLQILKINHSFKPEYIMKFLEINGINLKEFYFDGVSSDLNLSIAKFCLNLRNLFVNFVNGEKDTLRIIFNNCQYLEGIKIRCGRIFLSEKEVLKIIAKHSSKNFHELIIYNNSSLELTPKILESFFLSWKNQTSKKSIIFIIKSYYNSLEDNEEKMKIIEKYKNYSIIKKFESLLMDSEEKDNYSEHYAFGYYYC
ncbi:hypothetical protein C1645_838324 [Glomus cerebriforme]|uniref:F-box domain-containing protein n=1 Tax=Glomus cerebriforme TaxID=658196 RepID=A0A397S7B3_9GLOM|nr:hypothetical protein C1645_838324 [Glomus cerebriforme]